MMAFFRKSHPPDLVLGRRKGPWPQKLFTIDQETRASHMYVVGVSGMGKSKLLEYCLYQDIAAGRGVGLIDPHSQLADDLLRLLVTEKIEDKLDISEKLIYIDPSRQDWIIPFNVLATQNEEPYDIAASVLEAFRRTWPESLKEAPHFANVAMAALLVLIANKMTLMEMHRLLTNKEFREQLLSRVTEPSVVEFFHDRYDKWGREAPLLRESTLNKVGAFSLNPRLKIMLGQSQNRLDFRKIMDEGKILILDLGHSDGETSRLIGSLVVTGLEMAMRRRTNQNFWNLTIDEFAGYVANEGSAKTLAHVLSEGRKYRMGMTVAHQNLSQLSEAMLGALSNVRTKVVFEVGRYDAEYLAKLVGQVNPEEVKRDANTPVQHELFSTLMEQWEGWIDLLRFQPKQTATVTTTGNQVATITTIPIPKYKASEREIEVLRVESIARNGILFEQAEQNLREAEEVTSETSVFAPPVVPAYELVHKARH